MARNSVNWEILKAKENYYRKKLFNSRFDIKKHVENNKRDSKLKNI